MGSGRWLVIVTLGAMLVGAGCDGPSHSSSICHVDADCAEDERCDLSDAANRPMIVTGSCPFTQCTMAAECEAGSVCAPRDDLPSCGFFCQASCNTAGCEQGGSCGADGLCVPIPCDEENGLVCPDRWHCMPGSGAVGAFGSGSDLYGQGSLSTTDGALRAGCVPIRCDEGGGFSCHELYECDPANSEDAAGCVATSCTRAGRCVDDERQICATDIADLGTRVLDGHDCAVRTCLEGYECPPGYACDASSLSVTVDGCVQTVPESGVCVRN